MMKKKLAINGGRKIREGKSFPAWPVYGKAEEEALLRVLHRGVWGVGGTETDKFEKDFAAYQHCSHAVTMCNGTVTLRNALIACGLKAGDEVIVPPYTFLSTASCVVEANCKPVFADINPDTFCISPKAIEKAITPRTRAIIPVHFAGHMAEMDSIMAIAKKHDLYVIEDCAHAHGAEYKGRRAGSMGHAGSFSFQSSKNLCCGEGGIIVSNHKDIAERCWSIHTCGRLKDKPWYQHDVLGGNYRLSQFSAGLLTEQLKKLDSEMARRDENAAYLSKRLKKIPCVTPPRVLPETTRHGWHLYIFKYNREKLNDLSREIFLDALSAEGIPAVFGYIMPLNRQKLFADRKFGPFSGAKGTDNVSYGNADCPNAENLCRETSCWLNHPVLLGDKQDMDDIADAIEKIYENRAELRKR